MSTAWKPPELLLLLLRTANRLLQSVSAMLQQCGGQARSSMGQRGPEQRLGDAGPARRSPPLAAHAGPPPCPPRQHPHLRSSRYAHCSMASMPTPLPPSRMALSSAGGTGTARHRGRGGQRHERVGALASQRAGRGHPRRGLFACMLLPGPASCSCPTQAWRTCHLALAAQVGGHIGLHGAAPRCRDGRRRHPQLLDLLAPAAHPDLAPHQSLERAAGQAVGAGGAAARHAPQAKDAGLPPPRAATTQHTGCSRTAPAPKPHLRGRVECCDHIMRRLEARRGARQAGAPPAALALHAAAAAASPPPPALLVALAIAQQRRIWQQRRGRGM